MAVALQELTEEAPCNAYRHKHNTADLERKARPDAQIKKNLSDNYTCIVEVTLIESIVILTVYNSIGGIG